jgi:tRNA uridine 5-carbamoylmethylation protein Kti12
MAGLPGTGKSTRVRDLTTMNPDAFVYSTDNLIEEWAKGQGWTYDFAFAKYIDKATSEMNRMLDTAIREGMDIVWDQTNTGTKKREKIVRRMKNAGYTVVCECIRPPISEEEIDEWLDRLKNRPGKTIPDNVMSSMMENYTIPTLNEGFDVIRIFDMYGNLEK